MVRRARVEPAGRVLGVASFTLDNMVDALFQRDKIALSRRQAIGHMRHLPIVETGRCRHMLHTADLLPFGVEKP